MEIFIKVSQFILSLSLIIVLHEFGHYWPAKYFKIKVEKFYLFFDVNFSLFKKKIGDTEWGIGWLPLGGYVKIAGMIDESMDKEQMAKPAQPWEFRSKPTWQRLIVMLGGVTVNFILALIIYIGLAYSYGSKSIPVNSIKDGYLIENPILLEYGFQTGDKIIKANGEEFENYSELRQSIINSTDYEIQRNGEAYLAEVNLGVKDDDSSKGFIGIGTTIDKEQINKYLAVEKYSLASSIVRKGRRLIAVGTGFESKNARSRQSSKLLTWGLTKFDLIQIARANEPIDKIDVWLGKKDTVDTHVIEDIYKTIPKARKKLLKVSIKYNGPVEAPIVKDSIVGKLSVVYDGELINEYELLASTNVKKLNIFSRLIRSINYLIWGDV